MTPINQLNIDTGKELSLQSQELILSAAGASGNDGSCPGVHLRWLFGGELGKKHLPKGNYASNTFHFNKTSGDHVKIYRAPYAEPERVVLDFYSVVPVDVNHSSAKWIYNIGGKIFHVKFDPQRYAETLQNHPIDYEYTLSLLYFIWHYGEEQIEIESKSGMFYQVDFTANSNDSTETPRIMLETYSTASCSNTASKYTNSRKIYPAIVYNTGYPTICENGIGIKYKLANCYATFSFCFYDDLLLQLTGNTGTPQVNSTEYLGEYALSLDNNTVFARLDPTENEVVSRIDGVWPSHAGNDVLHTLIYKNKWSGETGDEYDKNIRSIVEEYIELSDQEENPSGITLLDPDKESYISLLAALNLGALDYHIARMLGLGTIDLLNENDESKYIYFAEYFTNAIWEGETSRKAVQHIAMSLPVSINDERLSYPVEVNEQVYPGIINYRNSDGEPDSSLSGLLDEDGFTKNSSYRFVSILPEPVKEPMENIPFFETDEEFNHSEHSFPIYAGIRHKILEETGNEENIPWVSPGLSYLEYTIDEELYYEQIPLLIPQKGAPLYVHQQKKDGIYSYGSYGINLFSRSTPGVNRAEIQTLFSPANLLLPPLNGNALLIREETPLFLTSESEQEKLAAIGNQDDKTLVRLVFEHNFMNEVFSRKIEDDYKWMSDQDIIDSTTIYPNDKEVYADKVKIFFRETLPQNAYGRVTGIEKDLALGIATIQTAPLEVTSVQPSTLLVPDLSGTIAPRYIGGVFIMGDQQYIIEDISPSPTHPVITIRMKEDDRETRANNSSPEKRYKYPEGISDDALFTVIENMQNLANWQPSSGVTINMAHPTGINREIIRWIDENEEEIRYLEKSRGFMDSVKIEKVNEFSRIENEEEIYEHAGLYKLIFTGYTPEDFQHPQSTPQDGISVEFHNGYVRLQRQNEFLNGGEYSLFQVIRTREEDNQMVLYIHDPEFKTPEELENNIQLILEEGLDPENELCYNPIYIPEEGEHVQRADYYPGYKVYLYANPSQHLTNSHILPGENEDVRYSVFGLMSINDTLDNNRVFESNMSVPVMMFAKKNAPPLKPCPPATLSNYATRPDSFGRATYSFTTEFQHTPEAILFYRSNDEAMLSALYNPETLKEVRAGLALLGGNDEAYLTDRWMNFFDFDTVSCDGYAIFPPEAENSYAFPIPDNSSLIDWINHFVRKYYKIKDITEIYSKNEIEGFINGNLPVALSTSLNKEFKGGVRNDLPPAVFQKMEALRRELASQEEESIYNVKIIDHDNEVWRYIDFIKQAVFNTFVPLTELPVIYKHINPSPYAPLPKKQNIKNKNGHLLTPEDPDYDIAPMASRVGDKTVFFTDFTLDGTSKNVYFYTVREMDINMNMGPFSEVTKPVKLVNTNPPEAPGIQKILPVPEVEDPEMSPFVRCDLNQYPPDQYIRKITLYRAMNLSEAESVRTMTVAKELYLDSPIISDENPEEDSSNVYWSITDTFDDMDEIPYGKALYYRVTVSRQIEYAWNGDTTIWNGSSVENGDIVIDYAPSPPSKIIATMMIDVRTPSSPEPDYNAEISADFKELEEVILVWEQTTVHGLYHVYKMNSQGNWSKIGETGSSDLVVRFPLSESNLESATLQIRDDEEHPVYHHFKVTAENSSGIFSREEQLLTIPGNNFIVPEEERFTLDKTTLCLNENNHWEDILLINSAAPYRLINYPEWIAVSPAMGREGEENISVQLQEESKGNGRLAKTSTLELIDLTPGSQYRKILSVEKSETSTLTVNRSSLRLPFNGGELKIAGKGNVKGINAVLLSGDLIEDISEYIVNDNVYTLGDTIDGDPGYNELYDWEIPIGNISLNDTLQPKTQLLRINDTEDPNHYIEFEIIQPTVEYHLSTFEDMWYLMYTLRDGNETISQYFPHGTPGFEGRTFYLDNDIDLQDYRIGIGDECNPFKGHFVGNYHQIENMNLDDAPEGYPVGLFGCVEGAIIEEVILVGNDISIDNSETGLICSSVVNYGDAPPTQIKRCFNYVNVNSQRSIALIGNVAEGAELHVEGVANYGWFQCYGDGFYRNGYEQDPETIVVAGLIAKTEPGSKVQVTGCMNLNDMENYSCNGAAAGLVGISMGETRITSSLNISHVYLLHAETEWFCHAGGIQAYQNEEENSRITACYSFGEAWSNDPELHGHIAGFEPDIAENNYYDMHRVYGYAGDAYNGEPVDSFTLCNDQTLFSAIDENWIYEPGYYPYPGYSPWLEFEDVREKLECFYLSLDQEGIYLNASGDPEEILLSTNTPWRTWRPSNITLSAYSGLAGDNQPVVVSALPNGGRDRKRYDITFSSENYLVRNYLDIYINGASPIITPSQDEIEINSQTTSLQLSGTANVKGLAISLSGDNIFSLPATYRSGNTTVPNGSAIPGDPGASNAYNWQVSLSDITPNLTNAARRQIVKLTDTDDPSHYVEITITQLVDEEI